MENNKKNETTEEVVVDQKDKEVKDLKNEIENLKQMIALLTRQQPQQLNVVTPNTDVVLVYCSDSLGHLSTAHVELDFNRWGEEFTLTRSQFDEVVGKYRSWFDQGILAVSGNTEEGIKIAIAKGIKTDKEYYLDFAKLESIGRLSVPEIEDLWNKTTLPRHRESIITYVKRKFIENDPLYHNREKIDLFNRLTEGGFTREQDELSGRIKIEAKQFAKIEI